MFLIMTQKFAGDEEGNEELHTVNIEWDKDENGRFTPKPIEGTEKGGRLACPVLAMGFRGPEDTVFEELVERDARSMPRPSTVSSHERRRRFCCR